MRSHTVSHQLLCALMLSMGLLTCTAANAWHGGGGYHGGGYYHGGGGYYHGSGGYYHGAGSYYGGYGGWGGSGVVIGVPVGGYYASSYYPSCSMVRQCYSNGACVERQICN